MPSNNEYYDLPDHKLLTKTLYATWQAATENAGGRASAPKHRGFYDWDEECSYLQSTLYARTCKAEPPFESGDIVLSSTKILHRRSTPRYITLEANRRYIVDRVFFLPDTGKWKISLLEIPGVKHSVELFEKVI